MKLASIFALVAITPVALAVSPVPAAAALRLPLCSGNQLGRTIDIPIPARQHKGQDDPCCVKGCHAGGNRKRIVRDFDTSQ